jgi:hypothetical protein
VVVDGLRAFLNRPLRDSDRARLFAIAVVLVLVAAALFAMLDDPGAPRAMSVPAAPSPMPTPAGPVAAGSGPLAPPEAPSEESDPPPSLKASSAEVAQARRAARAFLDDYLPYAYGQGQAQRIAHASPPLRRRLVSERPRVPATERRRRPRVVLLQADSVGRSRAGMRALVEDGARRYTVPLELEHTAAGWMVTGLGT